MPIFDLVCPVCAWTKRDAFEHHGTPTICDACGATTVHLWSGSRTPTVIDDSWPGGRVFENLDHHPVTCYSRTEYNMQMKARGLENIVQHRPLQGSDKSPHTTNWSSMSQDTLDNAAALVKRVNG